MTRRSESEPLRCSGPKEKAVLGKGSWFKFSTGVALSLAFLWILARELDLDALVWSFAGLTIHLLVPALGFLSVAYAVRIFRWWYMLRTLEPNLPFGVCVWPFVTGVAVNNVLPLRAGDALRIFVFRRQLRSPPMRVLGTVVIERILDSITLLGLFLACWIGLPEGVFPRSFVATVTWVVVAGVAATLLLVLAVTALKRFHHRPVTCHFAFLGGRRLSETVSRHGAHLLAALGVARSVSRVLVLLGLSVVTWALEGAMYMTMAVAMGVDAAPLGPWFSLAAGTLATLIPSAPGYLGTFDYFAALGLAAYGASFNSAVAFALTVHAVLWAPVTVAGLLYLILHGVRLRDIRSAGTFDTNRRSDS